MTFDYQVFGPSARVCRRGLVLLDRFRPSPKVLLHPIACSQAVGQRPCLAGERLLEAANLVAALSDLLVGLSSGGVGFLTRLECGLLTEAVGVTLGLAYESIGLRLGARQRV